MRGVIVPPSKLIVTNSCSPQGSFFYQGRFIIKGGDYINILYSRLERHGPFKVAAQAGGVDGSGLDPSTPPAAAVEQGQTSIPQKEILYHRRKSLTTIAGNPLPQKEIPYYGKKSLTIEGNPLLQKEISNHRRKSISLYRGKSLTIEGNPLIKKVPYYRREILYHSRKSHILPQKAIPYYRKKSLTMLKDERLS